MPAPDHPGLLLAEQRFELSKFRPALFGQLAILPGASVMGSAPKRQAEFLASRYATQRVLEKWGYADYQLANDAEGVPLWPQGLRGSLSHSHQRVVIALCEANTGYLPGVDSETLLTPERAKRLQNAIITADELTLLENSCLPFATALTMAFSVKESLYKALFPWCRQPMGFHSATLVAINSDGSQVTLGLSKSLNGGPAAGSCYHACCWYSPGEVMTLVVTHPVK